MKLGRGEVVLADMAPPMTGLVFPFLELLVITGLSWIVIGWMDVHDWPSQVRNVIVLIWFLLVLLRFVRPVVRSRRQRCVVTNKRVMYSRGRKTESIPLAQIRGASRYRGGLNIGVFGYGQPVYLPDVGRAKRMEELIRRQLPER